MIATASILSDTITTASAIGDAQSPEGRMIRFSHILNIILPHTPGNLCEIGAGLGLTTRILLSAAEKFDRQVLVIDPFENAPEGTPEGYTKPYPYEKFIENVGGEQERLILARHTSLSRNAWLQLESVRPLAFVFVDGLQFHHVVLNELYMLGRIDARVICVDDINRNTSISQVPAAVRDFLSSTIGSDYMMPDVQRPLIEGYLIRK